MKIDVINQQVDLTLKPSQVRALVKCVITEEGHSCDEVAIHFVDQPAICQLHIEYFDDPTPTDCISFPLDEEHLGDVFVCPQAAIEYAHKKAILIYDEVSLYIVHGLLHLMGYDDTTQKKRTLMRAAEEKHLNILRHKGLLLHG